MLASKSISPLTISKLNFLSFSIIQAKWENTPQVEVFNQLKFLLNFMHKPT